MYPVIEIYWVQIFVFWITLTLSFFIFLWILRKLSKKLDISFSFFQNRIIYFFISTIFFSRIFYFIAHYESEMSYINSIWDFLLPDNYNFSLYWAIFWFLLVLFTSLKKAKIDYRPFLDISVISLFFVLVFWYIWALFWWEVIWKPTDFWVELHYNSSFSPISPDVAVFPLALVYSFLYFIVFSVFYSLNLFTKTKWLLWILWLMVLAWIILSLDSFNYFRDDFVNLVWLSFNQILSIIILIVCFIFLFFVDKKDKKRKKTSLEENKKISV